MITYWVVRYVPDVARGEFVNIGLITTDGDSWMFRGVESLKRAKALGNRHPAAAEWWLRHLASEFDAPAVLARSGAAERDHIDQLRVRLNNQVQLTAPESIRGDDLVSGTERLFDLLVVDPHTTRQDQARIAVVHRLVDSIRTDRPGLRIARSRALHIGRQQTPVDLAVGTKTEFDVLSRVWSFDVKNQASLEQRILAASFALKRVREGGGHLQRRGSEPPGPTDTVPGNAEIIMCFIPPKTDPQRETLAVATDAWKSAGFAVVDASQPAAYLAQLGRSDDRLTSA